jgi:predicted TIM-barrel fold metal-dependent hydrolase
MTAEISGSTPSPGWDCHAHIFDGRPGSVTGHYDPPLRSLAMLEHEAHAIGAGRVVLVQPSVYGTDNGLLVEALRASGDRHRGIVVVAADVGVATLRDMHACGVRGVRFNLVSPAGNSSNAFAELAPRLRELGWHAEWYATPADLPAIAHLHERHRVRCVLDHLAGFTWAMADDPSLWRELQRVADLGAWIKLSGWYRLDATAPYVELDDVVLRVAGIFGSRCVWGSDWPHTRFLERGATERAPAYADTWRPVARALGTAHAQRILREHPAVLYA